MSNLVKRAIHTAVGCFVGVLLATPSTNPQAVIIAFMLAVFVGAGAWVILSIIYLLHVEREHGDIEDLVARRQRTTPLRAIQTGKD